MSTGTYSFVPAGQWIQNLPGLGDQTPDYVTGRVEGQLDALRNLPPPARSLIEGSRGVILDVGPGEGVSSMALAQFQPRAEILGLEMDVRHLKAAWPDCRKFPNLRLAWGTLPGTPSNPRVHGDDSLPPPLALPDGFCEVLHSTLGMSRKDAFGTSRAWSRAVGSACVLVLPRFWRAGTDSLSGAQQDLLRGLCSRLGVSPPSWEASVALPGFRSMETFPHGGGKTGRGWLLWLAGIFDGSTISLWDTLTDGRRSTPPQYELPDLEMELEVIVARK